MVDNHTLLQAGVNDKVSHELAEKILIEMGEFFQIQVSHLCLNNEYHTYVYTYENFVRLVFCGKQVMKGRFLLLFADHQGQVNICKVFLLFEDHMLHPSCTV